VNRRAVLRAALLAAWASAGLAARRRRNHTRTITDGTGLMGRIAVTVGPTVPASGVTMPTGNLGADAYSAGGYVQIVAEDFRTPCSEGEFLSVYPTWNAYPTSYTDTSGFGTYDPGILSVTGSRLRMRIHTNATPSVRVAAPYPRATSESSPRLYGRYDVCFRSDPLPGYKTAWLLWPVSDNWPADGEIDWPEGRLDAGETMSAYMHRQNGVDGSDQDAYDTAVTYAGWHVATTVWTSTACRFLIDGSLVGEATARIPNTPMRWVLQTEVNLSGNAPAAGVTGFVEIDWAVAYRLG
jgi:hypothetical protein